MHSRILDSCGIVRLQSWDAAATVPPTLEDIVGAAWPRHVGAVITGPVDVLCVGPTDWLVIGGDPDSGDLYESLTRASKEGLLRATNMSRGLLRLEIKGPDVREFLLKGCSLELHPDRFRTGQCARTRFAGVPAVLYCRDPSRFEAIVAASYREYLLAWIADS